MKLDKILKSASSIFNDVNRVDEVIEYIQVLNDHYNSKIDLLGVNSLQVNSPDDVIMNKGDMETLLKYRDNYNALSKKYDELYDSHDELYRKHMKLLNDFYELKDKHESIIYNYDVLVKQFNNLNNESTENEVKLVETNKLVKRLEEENSRLEKSKGLCQLDSSGICTYCDKRVILAGPVNLCNQNDKD